MTQGLGVALVPAVAVFALGCAAAIASARFSGRLRALERDVDRGAPNPPARLDLPREVADLAARLGARSDGGTVAVRQRGQMWSRPGAAPMAFVARQTASPTSLDYVWVADAGPAGLVKAADYYVCGVAGLEVRAAGLFTIASQIGAAEMEQGEALRYLAELPWNPDAILLNHDLDWTVVDPSTLKVARGSAAVTFLLDDRGLPATMSAPSRAYVDKAGTRHLPWGGRFSDYRTVAGRLIPMQGEVAWILDGAPFVYWRGTVISWASQQR